MWLLWNIVQFDGVVGDLWVVNGEDFDDKFKVEGDNGQVVVMYLEDWYGEVYCQCCCVQVVYQQGREEVCVQVEDLWVGGGYFKYVYFVVVGEDQQGGYVGVYCYEVVWFQ